MNSELFVIGLGLFIVWMLFITVRGIYRKYHKWQRGRLELAMKGIAATIVLRCLHPMCDEIKGKKFKDIDFAALKEKHRIPGHDDSARFLNTIFYMEVDNVVNSIREGKQDHVQYMQDAWINKDWKESVEGVLNEAREHICSDDREESYAWIKEFGEELVTLVNKELAEKAADAALDGKYVSRKEVEDTEEEYDYDYDDSDYDYSDDSSGGSTYVAPVVIQNNKSQKETVRSSSVSTPHTPWQMPRQTQTQRQPQKQPQRQEQYTVQRMNRGGQWENKFKTNNMRQADQQQRLFQNGSYRNQDANQKNVRWRIVDKDGKVQ